MEILEVVFRVIIFAYLFATLVAGLWGVYDTFLR